MFRLFPLNIAYADIGDLLAKVNKHILNPLILFIFGLALVLFLFGALRTLMSPGDTGVKEESRKHMLWGVIGMSIMVSVFGIMRLIVNTIGARVDGL